jgi:hypothetical protein
MLFIDIIELQIQWLSWNPTPAFRKIAATCCR